ncbi:MAG: tetratricopeptide repeat protein [Chloroflexota bacterium]
MSELANPYIAGAPVTEPEMFFGREDVFAWIERSLPGRYADHILVIHGQRRVGKTSILKQLPHRLPQRYIPVFFDLQGRTHTTLDRFLWWLAREITRVLKQDRGIVVTAPEKQALAEDPEHFDSQFLTDLQRHLGDNNLLLTFDEFDSLEEAEVKETFARPLIDHLRRLMGREGLNFIFSIGSSGRKLENMQAAYTEFFKAALYKKISFLGRRDAEELITRPAEGVVEYDRSAVDEIHKTTAGHPYFTQLVCRELFSYCQQTGRRHLYEADVQAVLDDVLERGTVNLKFVWDDASDLEKWVLAGIAHLEGKVDTGILADFLRRQRVRCSDQALVSALVHLRDKDVLTEDNRFVVHLMRIWLKKNRPLERVREQLIEVNPVASRYIEIGLAYKDGRLYDKAMESFRQALVADPDNLRAQVNIAALLLEQEAYHRAVAEFEKALAMDEEDVAARAGLCEAHLALGDQSLAAGKVKEAMRSYQQVLTINTEHTEARQRMAEIHSRAAERAFADGRDEEALREFEAALQFTPEDESLEARYAQIRDQQKAKVLAVLLEKVDKEQAARNLDRAIAILEEALKLAPSDESLRGRLALAKEGQRAAQLEAILARAEQASESGRWDDAVAALSGYLSLQPEDAAVQERLVKAQGRQRESRLGALKERARNLAKAEKWEEALATWREYLVLAPEGSDAVQPQIRQVEEGREMAQAYAQAQQAIAKKAYGQAVDRLKWIIAKDENYRDASTLLARAIMLRRGQRPRWQDPRVLAAAGAGAGIFVLLSFFLLMQPTSALRLALAPPLPTATTALTSPTAPTSTPTPRPTSTPTPTPTPIPLAWHRLYSGEILSRDTVTAIVIDPEDPDVLYVGTAYAGIYKSINGGLSWQPAMAGLGRAWVLSLAIDPRAPHTLYASVSNGGVYKTADGGETWQPVNEGIDYLSGWECVSIVVLDPQDSQHLYYTHSQQIYESLDGGESWANVRTSDCPNQIVDLVVHPLHGRTLFAADWGEWGCEGGLYESGDGGKMWTLTDPQLNQIPFTGLEIDSQNGEHLYAAMWDKAYASWDGGETWNPLSVGCELMVVSPQDGAEAYCASGNAIRKSRDGGRTWQTLTRLDLDTRVTSISVSLAAGETVLAGGEGFYISTDGGVSWAERSNGLGASRLDLLPDPSDSTTLYAVSPEGPCELYRSSDHGRSWELVTAQGCGLAFDAGGEILYRNGGNTVLRSQDRGTTWAQLAIPQEAVRNVAAHPQQPGTVYALYSRNQPPYIYISFDVGQNWQGTTGMQDIEDATLFFDHEEGQTIYAIGDLEASWSRDGGITWESCPGTEAWHARSASRLAVDPRDSNRLLLATRGNGVLISEDGCQSWERSNSGLGNLFVNTVAIDPRNPDVVYAGTDGGAYISFDGGEHWGVANEGLLGATVVYSIVVDPRGPGSVYAATPYGIFRLESR